MEETEFLLRHVDQKTDDFISNLADKNKTLSKSYYYNLFVEFGKRAFKMGYRFPDEIPLKGKV